MRIQAGTRFGPYEIVGHLGSGGMGEVYRARDTRLKREVAVKVLPAQWSTDSDRLQRFEREARAAGAINHPNVLAVYDVGATAAGPFLVCELLNGHTLRDVIRAGPLPPRKALDYAAQIAHGLAAAHEKGIVHRDLKPENIFLTGDGRVKILDFGLARLTEPSETGASTTIAAVSAPGGMLGTVGYMAPEQLRGEPVTSAADIFSFGVVLYEMLTGEAPFRGSSASERGAAILRDEPSIERARHIGPTFEHLLGRCLQKRANDRFHSAHDLALALEAVTPPDSAPSLVTAPAGRRDTRRWMAILLMVAAAALVTVAGVLVGLGPARDAAAHQAIAVLPLKNLSNDRSQEYFADGITEAIIGDLAKVRALRVISRTSVMAYKDTPKPLRQIAQELNATAVLEGSVQQIGERVRITTRLIDAATDAHLWGDTFDREMKDILSMQSEVAREAARGVRVALTPGDEAQLTSKHPIDPEAYRIYLQARQALNLRTPDGLARAVALLNEVVARESSYALAHAALAEGYSLLDDVGALPPAEAYPKAIAAARRALEIDPDLADAHASLGHILMHQRDWDAAKRELRRAIELNPSLAVARRWYSNALAWTGDVPGGLEEARQASALDPVSPLSMGTLGTRLLEARRYGEAVEQFRSHLATQPTFVTGHFLLAWAYALQGRHDEALAEAKTFAERARGRTADLLLSYVHAKAGRREAAIKIVHTLEAIPPADEPFPAPLAHAYVALGQFDKALTVLEAAVVHRPEDLLGVSASPDMDAIRGDARFQRIVQQLHSPSRR